MVEEGAIVDFHGAEVVSCLIVAYAVPFIGLIVLEVRDGVVGWLRFEEKVL